MRCGQPQRSANGHGPGIHIAPNDGLLLGARPPQCIATPFILNLLAAHSFYNFINSLEISIFRCYVKRYNIVLLLVTVSLCSALARILHFHGSRPQPFQVSSAPERPRLIIRNPQTCYYRYSTRGPLLLHCRLCD